MSDNSVNRFDIDDILEEARQKKLKRMNSKQSALSEDLAADSDLLTADKKRLLKEEVLKRFDSDKSPAPETQSEIADGHQGTLLIHNKNIDSDVSQGDNAKDNDVEVAPPEPLKPVDDGPAPADGHENKTVDDATRAFYIKSNPDIEQEPESRDTEQDNMGQIMLDSLLGDFGEDIIPEQTDDWETTLQRERRKKAENFKLQPPVALRLSGDEEENDPSEEPISFEDREIEDYCSYEDTDAVRAELIYRRRTGWLQLALSAMFFLTLGGFAVLYYFNWTSINPVLYLGLNVFLLSVAALVNHRSVGEGIGALLRLDADINSLPSVLVLLSIIHTLIQFLNPETITGSKADILAPAAAAALFFGALGRQMLIVRICRNFKFVSYNGDKYAAHIIEDRKTAVEIGRAAVALGDPVVCYLEKTDFITRFLENSYETDLGKNIMKLFVPFALGVSVLTGVLYALFKGSVMDAITVFASAVCFATPVGILTSVNFPLLRTAMRVLRHGAMIVGWQAAEDFGNVHALAVDALEVFPSESVLLHGIKTYAGARIDRAILDAAAVSISAGGPLSSVFRRVIQNKTDILKEVDTLVYEQDMGMSGWVGGRRVLIGNRRLLENHGVDVPSKDYEERYTKNNRKVVYLSTAGELSAMFVISYVADSGIKKALKCLNGAGITLLVRTCDPNVTEDLICETYDLDGYYVEVMGAPAGRSYEQLLKTKSEENDAVLASNGRLEGTAVGVGSCRRLYRAVRLALIVQIIGGALGVSLAMFFSVYAGIIIQPLLLILYSLFWTVLSWLFPALYRV